MTKSPHLHTEYSLGVTLQRAQQQAALGVSYADGAVVGANQQHPAGAFLGCTQAADASGAMALKDIQLLQSLTRAIMTRLTFYNGCKIIYIYILLLWIISN